MRGVGSRRWEGWGRGKEACGCEKDTWDKALKLEGRGFVILDGGPGGRGRRALARPRRLI